MHLHETLTLKIHDVNSRGQGVGYFNGFTFFVDGALPEEEVKISISELHKNYGVGKLLSIETPSRERVEPLCPHFTRCGGCQLMHLDYAAQLRLKEQRVAQALKRIAKLEPKILPCTPSPLPLAYRNKIQMPLELSENGVRMGLYAFSTHEIIEIDHCLIHCDLGEKICAHFKKLIQKYALTSALKHLIIKSAVYSNEALIILVTALHTPEESFYALAKELMTLCPEVKGVLHNSQPKLSNVILGKEFQIIQGSPALTEKLGDLYFRISAPSFFQINAPQALNLYQNALAAMQLTGEELVIDAFAGVGTLSLFFAPHVKSVTGIETVPEAIEDAIFNAELNKINNATFICAKAEEFLQKPLQIDVLLLNPPRKGCEESLLKALGKKKPKKILYISCDPATLARDLLHLKAYGYIIDTVQPYDMFPQTTHVETLVSLKLESK